MMKLPYQKYNGIVYVKKVEKIKFIKHIDIENIIIGIIITNTFNYLYDFIKIQNKANITPVTISVVVYIIYNFIIKNIIYIERLKRNYDTENNIHLDDIKEIIKNINSKNENYKL